MGRQAPLLLQSVFAVDLRAYTARGEEISVVTHTSFVKSDSQGRFNRWVGMTTGRDSPRCVELGVVGTPQETFRGSSFRGENGSSSAQTRVGHENLAFWRITNPDPGTHYEIHLHDSSD